jgi:hypothetical protein
MKMYLWTSERFEDWLEGSIIILAENVREARKKALTAYKKEWGDTRIDEFKKDISDTPESLEHLFIYGSS